MYRGIKARPHDLESVLALNPDLIEIHASSEDLSKPITGHYDQRLVVHLPEYDGTDLIDPASLDDTNRYKAIEFYKKAFDVAREWSTHFKGQPKVIMHPGGWSAEPVQKIQKPLLYDAFVNSMREINMHGVDFLVENMPPNPFFYGGQWYCSIFMDPRECLDYCAGNGYGFCWDACHAALWCNSIGMPEKILDFMRKVKPIMAHVHLSDAKDVAGEGIQIGEGTMPLKEIIRYLEPMQIGVVLEIWYGHKDNFRGFKIGWERLDAMLEKESAS